MQFRLRAATAAAIFVASVGSAAAYCNEPSSPYCINSFNVDQSWYQSCRSAMESYLRGVGDDIACVYDAARNDAARAQSEAERAVSAFNSKVRGY